MIKGFLEEMENLADQILKLDFENEDDDEQLISLQSKQETIRNLIEQAQSTDILYNDSELAALERCVQKEQEIMRRLFFAKGKVEESIAKFNIGKRARNSYNLEGARVGYFIDNQK